MLRSVLMFMFSFTILHAAAAAEKQAAAEVPPGCPIDEAIAQVDQFALSHSADMAKVSQQLTEMMKTASAHATKPGVPIGQQMTKEELRQFNAARTEMSAAQGEDVAASKYQRDVHVIAAIADVAELNDLYDVEAASLSDRDPRQFYFSLLTMLRQLDPQPHITPQVKLGFDCDMEAALHFDEAFNLQELNRSPVPQSQKMVADLERIRTLHRLTWKLFDLSVRDFRAVRWNETTGKADVPDHVSPGVSAMDQTSQELYQRVVPYIDTNMMSAGDLKMMYQAKVSARIQAEFPPAVGKPSGQ